MTSGAPRFALVQASRLKPHERVEPGAVGKLAAQVRTKGFLERPIVIDEATHVILDGHHRFAALERLGCQLVPCHLVDYNDPAIRVEHWKGGLPMDKRDIIAHALSGELYPSKTSRHTTLKGLPSRPTRLAELRPSARTGAV